MFGSCCGLLILPGGGGGPVPYTALLCSLGDLAAVAPPVAGVYTLPAGAYALCEDITLGPGEVLALANNVQLYGFGRTLSSDGAGGAALRVTSPQESAIWDLNITTTANLAPAVLLDSVIGTNRLNLFNVNLDGDGPALENNDPISQVRAWGGVWTGATDAILGVGGDFYLSNVIAIGGVRGLVLTGVNTNNISAVNCNFQGTTLAALLGSNIIEQQFSNCRFLGTTRSVEVDGTARVAMANCQFVSSGASCILLTEVGYLELIHGQIFAAAQIGVEVAGTANDIYLDAVWVTSSTCVSHTGGTQRSVSVSGAGAAAVTNGVNWAAANVPSDGLIINNFRFAGTNFLSGGITPQSPRVNIKACLNALGLQTETLIVP